MGSEHISPDGKIGLATFPVAESKPFLLRIIFIACNYYMVRWPGHVDGPERMAYNTTQAFCRFDETIVMFGRRARFVCSVASIDQRSNRPGMLKIRLRRMGAIRQPHYRIVVADARAPRDGAFIESLGHYNPLTNPATIQVDVAKYEEWKKKGAQPTDAVASLVKQFNRAARAEEGAADTTDKRTRT